MRVLTAASMIAACVLPLCLAEQGKHLFEQGHSNYGHDLKDKEHIQEHINKLAQNGKAPKLDDKDTLYYLFVLHDKNGDGYLDGHELRASIMEDIMTEDTASAISLDELTEVVDHVLEEDDMNGDGLISWEEYLQSQLYHGQT
ncbi:hypothetical protein BDF14DRAFT_1825318 [Spinellus fusiger]|nr:hypothetical protein BDF14DRAFT_1825318 [Spinellus fusiger]